MYKVFIVFYMSVLAIGCGSMEAKQENKNDLSGAAIYKQNCIVCHGIKGNMGAAGAFDLTKTELSLEERVDVLTNGRNTMPPLVGVLSEAQIEAVAEYSAQLKQLYGQEKEVIGEKD
ncbi:MAG: cytochrome c [Bacteroidetes bacterium]|nr:cytochrome c [Bacteroidota bacterium]